MYHIPCTLACTMSHAPSPVPGTMPYGPLPVPSTMSHTPSPVPGIDLCTLACTQYHLVPRSHPWVGLWIASGWVCRWGWVSRAASSEVSGLVWADIGPLGLPPIGDDFESMPLYPSSVRYMYRCDIHIISSVFSFTHVSELPFLHLSRNVPLTVKHLYYTW